MRALAWSAGASALLVAVYLALGGASYAPASVADPCAPRDWSEPRGVNEVGEQIVLSALDGAACRIGVSREDIVLAFEDQDSLEAFGREHGVTEVELERLARTGLERAVTDAENAGALSPRLANLIRGVVGRIPPGLLIGLLDRVPDLVFPDS
ncbi:MAG TPA: hypothetical protein VKA45_00515 [Gaiellaceae bacterium]|nr:hypothetical protein [Gaiellaceae bacterium]